MKRTTKRPAQTREQGAVSFPFPDHFPGVFQHSDPKSISRMIYCLPTPLKNKTPGLNLAIN